MFVVTLLVYCISESLRPQVADCPVRRSVAGSTTVHQGIDRRTQALSVTEREVCTRCFGLDLRSRYEH